MTELAPGAITTADLFRELTTITVRLAVIENQGVTAEQSRQDHETRIRAMERFRWTVFGFSAAIGSASGIIAALLAARHG